MGGPIQRATQTPHERVAGKSTMRKTRAETREDTRRLLRAAAISEFARNGFAGTSAESIAEAAGFSGGAFYSNYSSKQDIFLDVMRTLQAAEFEEWERVIQEGDTVERVLTKLAERAERFARKKEWLLMHVEMDMRAARDASFKREYAKYRAELRQLTLRVLNALFAKAARKVPLDVELLVDAWLAFSVGFGLYVVSERRAAAGAELRNKLFVPLLQGLLARAEPADSDNG
jgi:AcrR family transcriptional regulator